MPPGCLMTRYAHADLLGDWPGLDFFPSQQQGDHLGLPPGSLFLQSSDRPYSDSTTFRAISFTIATPSGAAFIQHDARASRQASRHCVCPGRGAGVGWSSTNQDHQRGLEIGRWCCSTWLSSLFSTAVASVQLPSTRIGYQRRRRRAAARSQGARRQPGQHPTRAP